MQRTMQRINTVRFLAFNMTQDMNQAKEAHKKQLLLYFHEAVLRNDKNIVDEIISHDSSIKMTVTTFQDYIKDIEFSPEQSVQAKECLDYLVSKMILTREACEDMKAAIHELRSPSPSPCGGRK